jgi:4-hydroxybenzoate polyprenyltransferase
LNDVCDAARDAVDRPGRPIPSGRVSRRMAATLAIGLLAGGLICCACLGMRTLVVGGSLVACVVGYDVMLKRTPLAPVLMGMCRGFNLMLGMSVGGGLLRSADIYAIGLMWLYVSAVTCFARYESAAGDRGRLRWAGAGALVAVVGLVGVQAFLEHSDGWQFLLVGVLLGQVAVPARRAMVSGTPADVQWAVKTFVLSIVLFDACLVFAARGPMMAALVAVLMVPSIALASRFRVT